MKSKVLLTTISLLLSFLLKGQQQITDIKYQDESFSIRGTVKTEDRYWFNVLSTNGTYLILTTDGEQKNTVLFNFDGLNIIPQTILRAIKADNYYYLLLQTESAYYVIRTIYKNHRWFSEEVVRLVYSFGEDFLKISENRIFVVQKHQFRVLEIEGLVVKEIYNKEDIENYPLLEDFAVVDNNTLLFLYQAENILSLLQIRSGKHNQIEWSGLYFSSSCNNIYQLEIDKNRAHLYINNRYFQINLDSLSSTEPFSGKILSNMLIKNESIFIAEDISEKIPYSSIIHEFSKSGSKIKDFTLKINHISSLLSIENGYVMCIQYYCLGPKIITYDIETHSYLTDWLAQTGNFLLIKNKLYFNGYTYGSAYYQDGKVYKTPLQLIQFEQTLSLSKNENVFSLTFQKDTILINENLLNNNIAIKTLSLSALKEEARLVNTNFARGFSALELNPGIHEYTSTHQFFEQTEKGFIPLKYNSDDSTVYLSQQNFFTFRKESYLINQKGLFVIKNSRAILITEIPGSRDFGHYFIRSVDQHYFLFAINQSYDRTDFWVSDGTPQGTKKANMPNFPNSTIVGHHQQWVYYVIKNYLLYSFDGKEEKLINNLGINNFVFSQMNVEEKTLYFFNRGDEGIEVRLLQKDNILQKVFTLSEFKDNRAIGISQILNSNVYQIYDSRNNIHYLLKIDSRDNSYAIIKLGNNYYADFSIINDYQTKTSYINLKKQLIPWMNRDVREVYLNTIFKYDEMATLKPVFQFKSKQDNLEKAEIVSLSNETYVFLNNNLKVWRIDNKTLKASRFISDKDNLRYSKIIGNDLYLNLCKDGECHLYKTNGSNAGTYRLTQKPLLVHQVYQFNDELYIHASDNTSGFQTWKLKPADAEKVTDLFDEKAEPEPADEFGFILSNETFSQDLVKAYPNPFLNELQLDVPGFRALKVFDSKGLELFEIEESTEKSTEALNRFFGQVSSGIYYLKITTNSRIVVKKLIKE